ncbi:unnamed protein product [Fraxinus pennsylvanica]|uniref:Uncharacterized protein n=1 Tax=Fraxinus pennsylvanica TaxID=56036 RepID=A0AAD1ZZL0_9LAMI|nr:unnamed protein product [Fraxinus pennsylvanica]
MVSRVPWFDRLLDDTGEYFCGGIVLGSVSHMFSGMYNSPTGECLIRGSRAVRMNAPRCGGYLAVYGGLASVLESCMVYARQKDDPWNFILAGAAASGFQDMRHGLGMASRSGLALGSIRFLGVGTDILLNKIASNVQSPQLDSNFEE